MCVFLVYSFTLIDKTKNLFLEIDFEKFEKLITLSFYRFNMQIDSQIISNFLINFKSKILLIFLKENE